MFEVSRRDLIIGAAGAAAAFGLDRPIAFIGAAQAQTIPAAPGFKSNKVGDLASHLAQTTACGKKRTTRTSSRA